MSWLIEIYFYEGHHQDAQACYEKAIDSEVDSVENHKGLLRSLMELGQQNKALLHATGAIAERSVLCYIRDKWDLLKIC